MAARTANRWVQRGDGVLAAFVRLEVLVFVIVVVDDIAADAFCLLSQGCES